MRDDVQRWLDGEIPDEALPPEERARAEDVRRLLATQREVGPAPSWLEQAVMGRLPEHRPGPWRRAIDWVTRPRDLRVRPVTVGALAVAVLAAVLVWPSTQAPAPLAERATPAAQANGRSDDGRVYVQFLYVAPEADQVAVAGDFNEWSEDGFLLDDPDGDGVWTGQLPLESGLHKYMFVVDGQWVTDPTADRYIDDGFGNRNALITVGQPRSSI